MTRQKEEWSLEGLSREIKRLKDDGLMTAEEINHSLIGLILERSASQILIWVKAFVDNEADPNTIDEEGNNALMLLFCQKSYRSIIINQEIATIFLEKYPDIIGKRNNEGKTVLMQAAEKRSSDETMEFLIKASKKNANFQNELNFALICAASSFRIIKTESLLRAGADPNGQNELGQTPLMIACNSGYHEVVKALLEAGADPNIQDKDGKTAAMYIKGSMSCEAKFESFKLTFKSGTKEEQTKLAESETFIDFSMEISKYMAGDKKLFSGDFELKWCYYHLNKIIDHLIVHKADFELRDKLGRTAMGVALDPESSDGRVVEVLLSKNRGLFYEHKKSGPKGPEYEFLTNPKDRKNIANLTMGSEWLGFSESIIEAVKNREVGKYPYVQLNEDGSVSFFIDEMEMQKGNQNFQDAIGKSHITEQLEYQALKHGFEKQNKEDFIQTKSTESLYGIKEYRINLSPENLDSILKMNPTYMGYRGENSLLKLTRPFSLKPGVVRLFPVAPLGEGNFIPQIAGCQTIEVPTVQLLHLLPNYANGQGSSHHLHWIPKEVENELKLNRSDVTEIMRKIFADNHISVTENGGEFHTDPDFLKLDGAALDGKVYIAEMDQDSKNFYAMYGNSSMEELNYCKSVEVDSLYFLQAIEGHLMTKLVNGEKKSEVLGVIGKMIEEEYDRRGRETKTLQSGAVSRPDAESLNGPNRESYV